MNIKVKLNDQALPIVVEVMSVDDLGAIFQYSGHYYLGGKEFPNQMITKRYLDSEYEVLEIV